MTHCSHCDDEIQDAAVELHFFGTFKGKRLFKTGTCYVLQQRAKHNEF